MRVREASVTLRLANEHVLELMRPLRWEQREKRAAGMRQAATLIDELRQRCASDEGCHFIDSRASETEPVYRVGYFVLRLAGTSPDRTYAVWVAQFGGPDDPVIEIWADEGLLLAGYGEHAAGIRTSDGAGVFQAGSADGLPFREFHLLPTRRLVLVVFELEIHCYTIAGIRAWRFVAPDVITSVSTDDELVRVQDFSGDVHMLDPATGLAPPL